MLGCWIEALIVQKIFHHKSQIKPLGCGSSNKVLSMFRFKLTQPIVKSCLTLCNPMDRSPPGPSVYGISQAKILEWVAIFFTRGFPGRSVVKNCLQMQEMQVWSLGQEDPLEKEGNRNPLQYSCLGNPMDRGAWRATAHGVAKESDITKQQQQQFRFELSRPLLFYFYLLTRVEKL